MLSGILARLSDSPKYERGMRAYDVRFDTQQGPDSTVVLTRGQEHLGEQIRQTLFASHPEATDYTFREFDYLDFQFRVFINRAIREDLIMTAFGDTFIDEAEL